MKLTFLGSGSAFTVDKDNFQSNMILENDFGKRLLIDCGSDIRWSLHKQGLNYLDIDGIFVSHLHSDHIGGLEWFALVAYFDPSCPKPKLYISDSYAKKLWENSLSGGLNTLSTEKAQLSAFFEAHVINESCLFNWYGLDIQIFKNKHVESKFHCMPSYGLYFKANGIRILITTDMQFGSEGIVDYYNKSDIIFQDCELLEKPSGVHAHYNQLKTLSENIKKKMWLYHYQNSGKLFDPRQDGFAGFVKRGQEFLFNEQLLKNISLLP